LLSGRYTRRCHDVDFRFLVFVWRAEQLQHARENRRGGE
jgi:hypothetical protein